MFKVLRLDAGLLGDVAKPHLLFPAGKTKFRDDFPGGKIEFSEGWCKRMAANWLAMGSPQLPVNYFHRGESNGDLTAIADKVAAGWMGNLRFVDGLGVVADIKWTDKARAHILADELRYLSPEFCLQYRSRDTGKDQGPTLLGCALLNDPFLKELPRVAASEQSHLGEQPDTTKADTMNPKLIALLKLAESSTEEQTLAAVESLVAKAHAADEGMKKLSDSTSATLKLAEANKELATKLSEAQGELTKLAEAKKASDVAACLEKLTKEGRILPVQHDAAKAYALSAGVEATEKLFSAKVIEFGEKGINGEAGGADKLKSATAKRDARVSELRKANPEMRWTEAEGIALSEMPELKQELYGSIKSIGTAPAASESA